jgi:hypothetical protein
MDDQIPMPRATQPRITSRGDMTQNTPLVVTGPGRCTGCGWHVKTQGHKPGCRTKTVTPDEAPCEAIIFPDAVFYLHRIEHAIDHGAPESVRETPAALEHWEAEQARQRDTERAKRAKVNGQPSADKTRHIALRCLARAEEKLSTTADGTRDTATCHTIYELGKFVNAGALGRDDVHDAIIRSAYANGLDKDRENGGIAKIQDDVDRGLDKAARDGITVEWTRFDWLTEEPESAGQKSKADINGEANEFEDDPTPVYASKLLSPSDLLALPDPAPLIDNVLDQGTTALLYGKWGTAKTFIALDWAASVATGHHWQGRTTEQRRVLYVVGEGAFGFKGRVAAWKSGWRTKIGDDQLSILPVPVNLTKTVPVDDLAALIEWGGYSLVILDTLARCMVGADENSAKDCGIVVDAMTRILASTPGGRGVVLGVHHAGKDGKTLRGSSAFESGVDTVYFASREDRWYSLAREKRKDGPEHDQHLFELDPIGDTKSAVLKASHGLSQGGETTERTATVRLIMSQHFSLTGATPTHLRQLAVDDGPMTRPTFYRAISDLLESGWLTNTGSDKRPFYFIKD